MKTLLITLLLSSTLFAETYTCDDERLIVEPHQITIIERTGTVMQYEHISGNFYKYGRIELKWYGTHYVFRAVIPGVGQMPDITKWCVKAD